MARPKKVVVTPEERLRRILAANLQPISTRPREGTEEVLEQLDERIRRILQLARRSTLNKYEMLYLVMYDIEDDRVRRHIARYLLEKGCIRIQKSVYMARTHQKLFKEMGDTLREVQAAYDNHDSILLVPFQSSSIGSMRIIGKDIQIDSLVDPPETLFF